MKLVTIVERNGFPRCYIQYQVDSMSIILPVSTSASLDQQIQQKTSDTTTDPPIVLMTDQPQSSTSVHIGYENSVTPEKTNVGSTEANRFTPPELQISPQLNTTLKKPLLCTAEPPTDLTNVRNTDVPQEKPPVKRKLFQSDLEEHT